MERVVLALSAVDLAVLAATGTWLVLGYRPTVAAGSPIRAVAPLPADWWRFVHRWSANLLVVLFAAWLGLALVRAVRRPRAPARAIIAAGSMALAAGGWVSGWMLPWDQLAMWSVTVGEDLTGYRMLRDDDRVRFVLVGATEVNLASLRAVLFVHALVIPIALIALLVLGWRSLRGSER